MSTSQKRFSTYGGIYGDFFFLFLYTPWKTRAIRTFCIGRGLDDGDNSPCASEPNEPAATAGDELSERNASERDPRNDSCQSRERAFPAA